MGSGEKISSNAMKVSTGDYPGGDCHRGNCPGHLSGGGGKCPGVRLSESRMSYIQRGMIMTFIGAYFGFGVPRQSSDGL